VLIKALLFSCDDCHAAHGDGDVNGTGIESTMTCELDTPRQFRSNEGNQSDGHADALSRLLLHLSIEARPRRA
jgi:hypothetical protein